MLAKYRNLFKGTNNFIGEKIIKDCKYMDKTTGSAGPWSVNCLSWKIAREIRICLF